MLEKVKNYLWIDGNYDDFLLEAFILAAESYIQNSLSDVDALEQVKLDPRYELCVLILTSHYWNHRDLTSDSQRYVVPHGLIPILQQLDMVAAPQRIEATINGVVLQVKERTAGSIELAQAYQFSGDFINIDGIDYRLKASEGTSVLFESLIKVSVLNENGMLYKSFNGFKKDALSLTINTQEDLTGKRYQEGQNMYLLAGRTANTYVLEPILPPVYEDSMMVYSTSTGALLETIPVNSDAYPAIVAAQPIEWSESNYYVLESRPQTIILNDGLGSQSEYKAPVYDFNEDYKVLNGSTIIKRGLGGQPEEFTVDGYIYKLSNPVGYVDHTIYSYTKELVPVALEFKPYSVYLMDDFNGEWGTEPALVKTGNGEGLFQDSNLIWPSYVIGAEKYVPQFYDNPTTYYIKRLEDGKWFTTVEPVGNAKGVWVLTDASEPSILVSDEIKIPGLGFLRGSATSMTGTTSNYVLNALTLRLELITHPSFSTYVPTGIRYGSSGTKFRHITAMEGTKVYSMSSSETANTNNVVKFFDSSRKFIGSIFMASVPDDGVSPLIPETTLPPHGAFYVEIPFVGEKEFVSFDASTNVITYK